MCGGFVGDVLDAVGDVVSDVGDAIGNAVESVVDNPIGAIVSIGGMALGIPPVAAGALGGAANAAANGGDVLEGALLGGAAGFAGGAGAAAAAEAGAGSVLSSAAGGAAAGATSAALTGGDIVKGVLTGGVMGAGTSTVIGIYNDGSGNQVYHYDDGSTITRAPDGAAIGSTPAPGQQAPVFEYNPSTGLIEQFNPNGQLTILDAQQTAELMKNVDPGLINTLTDQSGGEPFRVEIAGAAGTAEAPQYADTSKLTAGSQLATLEQIDNGTAKWNAAANAWEVGTEPGPVAPVDENTGAVTGPVTPSTYTFDDGSTFTTNPDGTTSYTDATGQTVNHGGGVRRGRKVAAGRPPPEFGLDFPGVEDDSPGTPTRFPPEVGPASTPILCP